MRITRHALLVFAALALIGCSSKPPTPPKPVVISVGDPTDQARKKLRENGHQPSLAPLPPQLKEAALKGVNESFALLLPYEVNGRLVVFTSHLTETKIVAIAVDGPKSVERIDVCRTAR